MSEFSPLDSQVGIAKLHIYICIYLWEEFFWHISFNESFPWNQMVCFARENIVIETLESEMKIQGQMQSNYFGN